MSRPFLFLLAVLITLSSAGCGYRFVDPLSGSEFALVSVRNTTAEPGLAALLEEEIMRQGGFAKRAQKRVSITITDFRETVESVSSDGQTLRQELTMVVAWKVEDGISPLPVSGADEVSRSYPYSSDLPTLDWNRSAAVRLLSEFAAQRILERLGEQP